MSSFSMHEGGKKHCKKCGHKRCRCSRKTRGGGIISTAAAPTALYAFARMAQHGKSKNNSNKSRRRTRRTRRRMRGGDGKQRGGSVLGNALPSLVLYGLARGMRKTKNNNNNNNNNNGRKTRKNRSRRGRRM